MLDAACDQPMTANGQMFTALSHVVVAKFCRLYSLSVALGDGGRTVAPVSAVTEPCPSRSNVHVCMLHFLFVSWFIFQQIYKI